MAKDFQEDGLSDWFLQRIIVLLRKKRNEIDEAKLHFRVRVHGHHSDFKQ